MTDTVTTPASPDRYNAVAKILHWLIALAILGLLAVGWFMTSAFAPEGPARGVLYLLHKSTGITVLALSVLRLVWRLSHRFPSLPDGMALWEKAAARITHVGFYVLMIGMPLSGWALSSVAGHPVNWFGLVMVPNLPITDDASGALKGLFAESHEMMAWAMLALFLLHVGAALKHQFVNRDGVLKRMLPTCCCHAHCKVKQ